ncbi:hypothetical protein LAZ67_7002307 [Cordylochernes scorpioides]|uniref:Uncharacterized protein n=1 Tax=Cordylochernes scorpioides TaxID=51811 RepID=A0ABY6KT48_9ARAC|nr:hypothetical protein LAZ67_7002307 [Cordylochernes scorpioides]
MKRALRSRAAQRTIISKLIKRAEAELDEETPSEITIRTSYKLIEKYMANLQDEDKLIWKLMLEDKEIDYKVREEEKDTVIQYDQKWMGLEIKINNFLSSLMKDTEALHGASSKKGSQPGTRVCRLPNLDLKICDGSSLEGGMSEKPSVVGVTLMKGVDPASIKEDAGIVVLSEQMVEETSTQIAVEESHRAQVEKRQLAEKSKNAQVKKKSVVEVDESNRAEIEKKSVEADEEKGLDVEPGMDSKNTEEVELLYAEQGTDSKIAERLDAEQGTDSKVADKLDAKQDIDSKIAERLDAEQGTDSKVADKLDAKQDIDSKVAEKLYAEQGTDSKIAEKLDAEQGTDSKVAEKLDAEQGTDSKIAEKLDAEQGTDSKVAEKLDAEQGTDSKVAEKLDAEQGTDSKVAEKLDAEQGTDSKVAEKLDAEQGTDSKVAERQDADLENEKDSEAETKDNEVRDSETAVKGYESVSNSKAVADGDDQVEISDGKAESIDDIEERVVRVPPSRKLVEAGQTGDAEFKEQVPTPAKGLNLGDKSPEKSGKGARLERIANLVDYRTIILSGLRSLKKISESYDSSKPADDTSEPSDDTSEPADDALASDPDSSEGKAQGSQEVPGIAVEDSDERSAIEDSQPSEPLDAEGSGVGASSDVEVRAQTKSPKAISSRILCMKRQESSIDLEEEDIGRNEPSPASITFKALETTDSKEVDLTILGNFAREHCAKGIAFEQSNVIRTLGLGWIQGKVAQMIDQAVHMRNKHGSVHLMLSTLGQKYWMLRAKRSESNSEIIAYADDLTVICWGNNLTELRNTTGKVMERILDWCGNNKLTVSEEKTKILYLFNSKIAAKIPNTITANQVEKLKIMGITFKNHRNKNKLDFVPHIDEIITKTNRASGYLIGLTGKAWGLDSKRRIELYKTLFRSSLTYGSTIWYNFIPKKVKDKLNSLQYKILKHSTQVYNSTSSNCTHIVARTPKLTDFIETNILKMNIGYKISDPTKRKIISNFINHKFEEYYGGANDNFKGFFDTSRIPNYVQPNFYNVQFFTGHGRTYLPSKKAAGPIRKYPLNRSTNRKRSCDIFRPMEKKTTRGVKSSSKNSRVDRRILRQAVAAQQATCTAILQHVQDTLDHFISTRTISRRLVANGLRSCRPLRRLPLTPPNRRQRLEWCRARSTWMTEWHRVVFSDESRFCLSSDSRRVRVWRRRGERSNPAAIVERPTVRQRGIMVWGAIAYDSRSPLLRIQGTMTAQRYVDDVLRPVTLPYLQGVPNALYQQDNARPHTARISQQALQDVQMLPWPPYSPDLSPIEHVWDIIGRRLHALPQPRSEDELWQMSTQEPDIWYTSQIPMAMQVDKFPDFRSLRLRGHNRFFRPPDLLAPERWLQATVGVFPDGAPALARSTRAALRDAQHFRAFCQRLLRENANSIYHAEYKAEIIVFRRSATSITHLTNQRARRALESTRLQAHPTAELAARWTPTVDVPRSIPWADLRRNCFSGHDADVALRLALNALPHPDHPVSRRATCGSSDGSLTHRYWSCRAVRPLHREVFAFCDVPLDL